MDACRDFQACRSPAVDTMRMITMSLREINRLKTIQAVADGNLKPSQAAGRLKLTVRQVRRVEPVAAAAR